jgi:tRNA threonylcarbamoyladenosine biosynthesis protein TsaB
MAFILNIDSSAETASVCLSKDGTALLLKKNEMQKDHAAWLHVAIKEMMDEAGYELSAIDAVAVTIGPGSYTGLRVGLSAAKGFCYALDKPLITVNTLLVMASALKNEPAEFLCPMIDARRMEVFTAIYTKDLAEVKPPMALIMDENSFKEELQSNTICFSGSGSKKLKEIIENQNARFSDEKLDAADLAALAEPLFEKKQFADIAYTEPLYLKEFYYPAR